MRTLAAAAVVGLAVVSAAAGASLQRPSLRITALEPAVAVRGAHFRPHERVRLTLSALDLRRTRVARVRASGTLAANLGPLPSAFDPCTGGVVVLAVGASGDRATAKLVPRECPPAP